MAGKGRRERCARFSKWIGQLLASSCLSFFPAVVFLSFPFRKLAPFTRPDRSAGRSPPRVRSFNALFERPRAGNWKFRASDPVHVPTTAGLIPASRRVAHKITRKKKPETSVDRDRSKRFYRSNLYPFILLSVHSPVFFSSARFYERKLYLKVIRARCGSVQPATLVFH